MENQANPSRKSVMLNFGLILGFISIISHLLMYVFGNIYQPHWSMMLISVAISLTFIMMALKKVREAENNLLSIGTAIKVGLGISLISAIVYSLYLAVFVNMIEPAYFENLAQVQEQAMLERYPNMTDEQMEAALNNAKMFNSTGAVVTMTLIVSLFFGLILSLVAGLIMRKSEDI